MLLIYPLRVWHFYAQVNTNNINKTSVPYKQQEERRTEHRIYAKIVTDITPLNKERKEMSYDKKLDTTIRKDNVNKTWAHLQTSGGNNEPNIVFMQNSFNDFDIWFWSLFCSNVFQLPGSRRLSLPFATYDIHVTLFNLYSTTCKRVLCGYSLHPYPTWGWM